MKDEGRQRGHIHPISSLIREANAIFYRMGFSYAEGPLLEEGNQKKHLEVEGGEEKRVRYDVHGGAEHYNPEPISK